MHFSCNCLPFKHPHTLRDAVTSVSPGCGLTVAVQPQWKAERPGTCPSHQPVSVCRKGKQAEHVRRILPSGSLFLIFFSPSRGIALCHNHWNQPRRAAQTPALTWRTLSVDLGCMWLCPKFFCKSETFHRSGYSELKMGEQSGGYGFVTAFLQDFNFDFLWFIASHPLSWLKNLHARRPWSLSVYIDSAVCFWI